MRYVVCLYTLVVLCLLHHCVAAVQFMKEYSSKVDLLMSERKEAKEAVEAAQDHMKQHQAQVNAYATLMPLALPAPVMPGSQPTGYGDMGGGFAQPGYGQAAAGYTGQYTGY